MLWSTYISLPHSSNNVLIMRCMKGTDLRDLQSTVFIWWIWMRNRWEDLAVFKLAAMHLWKWSAVLIDILWQATLPGCWYKSPADSAVSRPLLYWLSHWSSLWSTKGKETCKQAHARTHTHPWACMQSWPSHYFLTLAFSLVHISLSAQSRNTQTCQSRDSLFCQGIHSAWGYNTRHKALQCWSPDICTVCMYVVGIGLDVLHVIRTHKSTYRSSY